MLIVNIKVENRVFNINILTTSEDEVIIRFLKILFILMKNEYIFIIKCSYDKNYIIIII